MKRILIAAVASSLVTGAVIAATGIARSGGDDSPPQTMKQALAELEKRHDQRLERIAKRLDVSTDDLKQAIEKVRTQELENAVKAGRLTEAQKNAILACRKDPLTCDRSNLPAPRFHGGPGTRDDMHRGMRDRRSDFFSALAKELNKSEADVRAAFEAERPRFKRRWRGDHGPGGPGGRGGPGMMMPGGFGGPAPPGDPA
jgi:hypothetical protein